METELRVKYDSRKSFYGKARVFTEGNRTTLRSYSTDVAYIEDNQAIVKGSYSQTTLRHIKEFLKQNGFKAESQKQILEDYSETQEQSNKRNLEEKGKTDSMFKTVGLVASLGDVFCRDNQKEANDWKARMLKAGLSNQGLTMPEDWETLTEEEKEKRLNGVLDVMNEPKI